ncbi:electron transport complex subunit RsxC [Parasalinivibrio latis]|uniref:electron transport complex subunit RsxC n=1 Tax=Parasalinivibrio latis TaxID=2952610 RepID=UPI0030E58929
MLSIIEKIKHGQRWDFHGGVHPPENKTQSNHSNVQTYTLPSQLILPLKQHIGTAGKLLVSIGDSVKKGEPLTQADLNLCLPVHAPTSGTIVAVEERTIAHPSGLSDLCIVIEPDGLETWSETTSFEDYTSVDPQVLVDHIRHAGISGLGGAGFPTGRKLQSGLARTEILILNAAECEPYITADDCLMQQYADEVIEGARILGHILQPKLTVIGIEDNKPAAINALKLAAQGLDNLIIQVIPTKYPSGGEKQLIKILTGKEVPAGAIPAEIGIMMQNVGTAFAIKRAVVNGEPLIQRMITVTGNCVEKPGNTWALLGTPVQHLLEQFSYKADKKLPRVIMGGPMMGFTLPHCDVPVTKITNCLLVPTRKEIAPSNGEMSCIRCSACADACPANLLPQQLYWYAKDSNFDKCGEYNLFDCIECGACAYVCPSEIPLVQYYRTAKAEVRAIQAEKLASDRARERFEAKKARLEREKEERENRHKQAAAQRRQNMSETNGEDLVAAAIARVKAKSEKPETKPAIAAAIARAKAKQAEAAGSGEAKPDNSEMAKLREERKRQARERKAQIAEQAAETPSKDEKKDAVAAAIARAKARKAAQQADAEPATEVDAPENDSPVDAKKAAVAAAVARAKARKATQQTDAEPAAKVDAPESDSPVDAKKAAVAAAVDGVKARKAAQQADSEPATEVDAPESDSPVDAKKAAVAAAVARAKARKAAQQADSEPATEVDAPESDSPVDAKKAAVAAAVARAKARKAAQQADAAPATEVDAPESDSPVDAKKAAVAAAVARAKARKASQQAEAAPVTEVDAPESDSPVDAKKAAVAAAVARAKARKAAQQAEVDKDKTAVLSTETPVESTQEQDKKAKIAAAVARAKARKVAEKNTQEDS